MNGGVTGCEFLSLQQLLPFCCGVLYNTSISSSSHATVVLDSNISPTIWCT